MVKYKSNSYQYFFSEIQLLMEKYKGKHRVVPVYTTATGQTGRYRIQLTYTVKFNRNIMKGTE